MQTLTWIIASGLAMAALALVGSLTLLLSRETLRRILVPLVAFAAGTLIGGALLHMLPEAIERGGLRPQPFLWVLIGFSAFFALELFLRWHHSHEHQHDQARPMNALILIGDGLHNLLDGLAVGSAFVVDIQLGISTWLAAAAHEIPQEFGDFAVLVHGGWKPRRALFFNVVSGLSFLLGSLAAYLASYRFDVTFLLPFAAGNFLYIAASDLIPDVKSHRGHRRSLLHFTAFIAGIALLYVLRIVFRD